MREVAARNLPDRGIERGHRGRDVADEEYDNAPENEEGDQADECNDERDVRDGSKCLVVRDVYNDRPARCTDRFGGEIHIRSVKLGFKHFVFAGHQACAELLVFAAVHLHDGRIFELMVVMVDELALRTKHEHSSIFADLDLVEQVHDLGE